MFKLYDMISRTLIDQSFNEVDIISTLNDEIKEQMLYKQKISYLILTYINDEPIYITINSFEDFIDYVEKFQNKVNTKNVVKKR